MILGRNFRKIVGMKGDHILIEDLNHVVDRMISTATESQKRAWLRTNRDWYAGQVRALVDFKRHYTEYLPVTVEEVIPDITVAEPDARELAEAASPRRKAA